MKSITYLNLYNNFVSLPFISSEGSVIAYYLSEFHVPLSQEAAVDNTMKDMDEMIKTHKQRRLKDSTGNLMFNRIDTSGT